MVAYFHLQKFLFACDSGHFLTKVKVYARQMHVSILVIFLLKYILQLYMEARRDYH